MGGGAKLPEGIRSRATEAVLYARHHEEAHHAVGGFCTQGSADPFEILNGAKRWKGWVGPAVPENEFPAALGEMTQIRVSCIDERRKFGFEYRVVAIKIELLNIRL